jgi:AraC-like DNA-binding protein
MRWEEYSTASGPADTASISLRTIWRIVADPTYDIPVTRSRADSRALRKGGGTGLIAIRTFNGSGEIQLADGMRVPVVADQLLFAEWERIRRYRCTGDKWDFWWFEFEAMGPLRVPMLKPMPISAQDSELLTINQIFFLLRSGVLERRSHAAALFSGLLYGWLSEWHEAHEVTRAQELVWGIVERMHDNIAQNWAVRDMAEEACLSERRLNQLFQQVAGVSPKRYYDRIRLILADELLQTGVHSVKAVADRLGFCNPYHFSRFFRSHMGYPPSEHLRRKPLGGN